jgi:hypothetical protein
MLSEELEFLIISLVYIEHYSTEQILEYYNKQIPLETIEHILKNAEKDSYIDNAIKSFISA